MLNRFSLLDPSDMKVYISIQFRIFSSFVCYNLENKDAFFQVFTFQNCFHFL